MTQRALPHLEKTHGHVIFTASIFGTKSILPNMLDYNVSKAALKMMVKIIAKEEGNKYKLF